jgi:hypothetical protein
VSTPAARSRRAAKARPRTLSGRSGSLARDDAEAEPRRRAKPSRSRVKAGRDAVVSEAVGEPPAGLSSRGQKMYAAMSARQASAADEAETEPRNLGASIRRLVVGGIAAALLVASATHVTSISAWVADHVPGVGNTDGNHHPKGGDDSPGRSANLDTPGTHKGDGSGKPSKP